MFLTWIRVTTLLAKQMVDGPRLNNHTTKMKNLSLRSTASEFNGQNGNIGTVHFKMEIQPEYKDLINAV